MEKFSGFLALPREVRDMVYAYVILGDGPIPLRCVERTKPSKFKSWKGTSKHRSINQLLLTSRQLYAEVKSIYYSHSDFSTSLTRPSRLHGLSRNHDHACATNTEFRSDLPLVQNCSIQIRLPLSQKMFERAAMRLCNCKSGFGSSIKRLKIKIIGKGTRIVSELDPDPHSTPSYYSPPNYKLYGFYLHTSNDVFATTDELREMVEYLTKGLRSLEDVKVEVWGDYGKTQLPYTILAKVDKDNIPGQVPLES